MRLENAFGGNVVDLGPITLAASGELVPLLGLGIAVEPEVLEDDVLREVAVHARLVLGPVELDARVGVFLRKPGRILGQG